MSTVLIKLRKWIPVCLVWISATVQAQDTAEPVLQQYLQTALSNNLVLQQKNIGIEKAMLALKSANALFLPSLDASAAYQSGDGGRYINLPIGDLLNPVYSTLNQMTGTSAFPQVENVQQSFLPNNFYDAKLHATMALFNADLLYNRSIQSQKIQLSELEVQTYKRELMKEVKLAWYRYSSASDAVKIYENALELAKEGERVNRSLESNGKALPASVIRSKAEVASVTALLEEARRTADNARLYFNFLLNVSPDSPVEAAAGVLNPADWTSAPAKADPSQREELKMLNQATAIQQTVLKMNRSFSFPQLGAFADAGFQADGMKFDENSDYYLVGVQLNIPLFRGFGNRHKIAQTKLDLKLAQLKETETNNALQMSITAANNRLLAAVRSWQASSQQLEAAASYHRLVEKGYREGVFSFIEMLDARNQQMTARLQENLSAYKVRMAAAELERETATTPIP